MPMPLKNWKEALDGIEYDPTVVKSMIVDISGVLVLEVGGQGWKTRRLRRSGASGAGGKISDKELGDALFGVLLFMARDLLVEAGYDLEEEIRVWYALLFYVQAKFLSGATYDLAARADVEIALNLLPQMKAKIEAIPGLIAGIAEDDDCIVGPDLFNYDQVMPFGIKLDLDPDELAILRSVFTDEGEPLPIIRPLWIDP